MWAVESNGVVSAVEERQRVGFYAPTPPGGHEPTLVRRLARFDGVAGRVLDCLAFLTPNVAREEAMLGTCGCVF